MSQQVFYRAVVVHGLSIFYRESGPPEAPTFFCSTAFPLHPGSSSRCLLGLQTITILSHLTTRDLGTVTDLNRRSSTKRRHLRSDPDTELYDPDLWHDEHAFLNAEGQAQIQSDLFFDYRTNVRSYPKWQNWLKKTQPRLM